MDYPLRRKNPSLSLQETFLRLAQLTTPHGYEPYCWAMLPLSESDHFIDEHNNVHIWVQTPQGQYSRIMWSCHLDSACQHVRNVIFRRTKSGKISTDGKSILSADCKIGAALMIKMIEAGVPGWYVFHAGEECGGVGSKANSTAKWPYEPEVAIAFDRMDYHDIITHQGGRRTASDKFGAALAAILNKDGRMKYANCDGGSFTDTKNYIERISECTNISVGYFRQHTHGECQDMTHAEMLFDIIIKNKYSFEKLPAYRDIKATEYKTYAPYVWKGGQSSYETGKLTKAQRKKLNKQNISSTLASTADDDTRYKEWWESRGLNALEPTPIPLQATIFTYFCNECKTTECVCDHGRWICDKCGGDVEKFDIPAIQPDVPLIELPPIKVVVDAQMKSSGLKLTPEQEEQNSLAKSMEATFTYAGITKPRMHHDCVNRRNLL